MLEKETGKDKIKRICALIKDETLAPAKKEAEVVLKQAHEQAEKIKMAAQKEAEQIIIKAKEQANREIEVFNSSMTQAYKQTLEKLKQTLEKKLINQNLINLISNGLQKPEVIAKLIEAIIEGIRKQGIDSEVSVFISSKIPARTINSLLTDDLLHQLHEKSVLLSNIGGGVQIRLTKENITIDASDEALKELIAPYIRKDLRELLFGS